MFSPFAHVFYVNLNDSILLIKYGDKDTNERGRRTLRYSVVKIIHVMPIDNITTFS
jgi:hypothetical protein